MTRDWSLEPMGEHSYLVSGTSEGDPVEVRVRWDSDFVDESGLAGVDDETIVDATMDYLLGHQSIDDLPDGVELDEVAAAYEDFVDSLRTRLEVV